MKKNNKAFTLIELLAIIVILAIIAVITVPIILNIIENSRKGAAIDSAYGYKDAIEKYYVTELSKNPNFNFENNYYEIDNEGMLKEESGKTYSVQVSGSEPSGGYLLLENNAITDGCLTINGYKVDLSDKDVTAAKGQCGEKPKLYKKYDDGTPIYFDVTKGKECTAYEAVSDKGTKENCMKFYAILDNKFSSTVDLLLDHNTSETYIAWNKSGNNTEGPKEVLEKLEEDTNNWNGVEKPTNYTASLDDGQQLYTINYSEWGNKARLISAEEINEITGKGIKTISNIVGGYFYDSCSSGDCSAEDNPYGWLFDHMGVNTAYPVPDAPDCTKYGCNAGNSSEQGGYWTASPIVDDYNDAACRVGFTGYLINTRQSDVYIANHTVNGVRPVITVSKSLLLSQ